MDYPSTFALPDQAEQKQPSQPSSATKSDGVYQENCIGDIPNPTADSLATINMAIPPTTQAQEPEYRYKIYKYGDLKKLPRKKWSVQGFCGPRDIGIFFGPPGKGKTSVILNMMVDMSLGQQIANAFEVERPLRVLYCAGEGNESIEARIDAAASRIEETDLPNIAVMPSVPQLYSGHNKKTYQTESTIEFIQNVKAQDETPDVLIIDTLHSAAVGAKENDSTDMGIVLHNLKVIAKDLGCTIFLIHHTTKDGENFRGSSALEGDVDLMVKIDKATEPGDNYAMKCVKLKDGKNWGCKSFKLIETGSSICVDWIDGDTSIQEKQIGMSVLTMMSNEPDKRFSSDEMAVLVGKKPGNVRNALNRLVKNGKCKRHEDDKQKGIPNRYSIN